ncbi:MAG: hypothetical protein ACMXYA_00590 [Candidatus Woesearchaeota archaeon]
MASKKLTKKKIVSKKNPSKSTVTTAEVVKPESTKTENSSSKPVSNTSSLYVVFGFLVLLVIILSLMIIVQQQSPSSGQSMAGFDYWFERTLDGYESERNYEYNGFVFVQDEQTGYWQTLVEKDGQLFSIRSYYGPRQLEDIVLPSGLYSELLSKENAIISIHSSVYVQGLIGYTSIGGIEISKVLGQANNLLNKNVISAVADPIDGLEGIAVADCQNVTSTTSVILYEFGAESQIIQDDNGCIRVIAPEGQEFIRLSNRIMFELLEIMDEELLSE